MPPGSRPRSVMVTCQDPVVDVDEDGPAWAFACGAAGSAAARVWSPATARKAEATLTLCRAAAAAVSSRRFFMDGLFRSLVGVDAVDESRPRRDLGVCRGLRVIPTNRAER